jgi:hypothetical protein
VYGCNVSYVFDPTKTEDIVMVRGLLWVFLEASALVLSSFSTFT